MEHGATVAKSLRAIGCDVHVVELDYSVAQKDGKDVSDWFADGHTDEEFGELLNKARGTFTRIPEPDEAGRYGVN